MPICRSIPRCILVYIYICTHRSEPLSGNPQQDLYDLFKKLNNIKVKEKRTASDGIL